MKRIYITIGVLLFGMVGMAYLYFSNLNTEANANDLSLNAVTKKASIIFSFENQKSFYEIMAGQELFKDILGEEKSVQFKNLQENLIANPSIYNALGNQKIYIGFLATGDNHINYLITTQLETIESAKDLIKDLSSTVKVDKIAGAYQLTFRDSTKCFVAIEDRLISLSNSVKNLQKVNPNDNDEGFTNYIKTNSRFNKNNLANLYLNYNTLVPFLKDILNSSLTGELTIFNKQNSYASFSYNFSKEKILFNGYTEVNDEKNYLKIFANEKEQKLTISNILPNKTANYTSYLINDYAKWNNALNLLLNGRKEKEKIDLNIKNINQKYTIDLSQIFANYFKNQLITFQIITGEKLGAIALSNGEKVEQLLLDVSTEFSPEIQVFKESNILYSFYGDPFKKFIKPYYTIIDNNLVVANNASTIQSFLNSYKNNELLVNDADYISFAEQLSDVSTISFYVNNKNSNQIFGRNLKRDFYKQYQSEIGFKKYIGFSYQLSGENGKFLTNLLLLKNPDKPIDSAILKH